MVIGGQAVLCHGRPRITIDIDLMLAASPAAVPKVIERLEAAGFEPLVENSREFVLRTHVLPFRTARTHLRVDMSFTDSPYETQAIARGVDVEVDGVAIRFASAEDLVVHKIIAGRAIDHQDVLGILLKNPDLDAAYVRDWLSQFAQVLERPLVDDFERLWRDAQQP